MSPLVFLQGSVIMTRGSADTLDVRINDVELCLVMFVFITNKKPTVAPSGGVARAVVRSGLSVGGCLIHLVSITV